MLSSMTFYSWRGISIYFIQEILIVSFYKTFFFTNHCTNKMLQQYFNNLIQCIFNFLKVTQKSLSSTHTHTQTHTHTHTHTHTEGSLMWPLPVNLLTRSHFISTMNCSIIQGCDVVYMPCSGNATGFSAMIRKPARSGGIWENNSRGNMK